MARALLVLQSKSIRDRAARWAMNAPSGTRVEFREPKRSTEQNDKMWAMLTDVSKQVEHAGRRYPPETWKDLFMHALGRETTFIPALDGQTFIPLGYRSSELSKAEMCEMIDLIDQWGTQHGVAFHDTPRITPSDIPEHEAA